MQPKYEHTQKGGKCFYILLFELVIIIVLSLILLYIQRNLPIKPQIACFTIVFFAILEFTWFTVMLSSLSVTIDDQYIRIAFGRWAFRKKLLLTEISDCQVVNNDWWWMRIGGRFDIGAKRAVEIVYKNGKKKRIGTDDPENLALAIQEAIGNIKAEV